MGRVKTRLSRDLGYPSAVGFYRSSVSRLLCRLGRDPRWVTALAVNAPVRDRYQAWPEGVLRCGQGRGSLGDRMNYVLDNAGPGPVIIIGTDTPHIEPHHIAAAFAALGRHDAVFGPANDGGYWLLGLARRRPAPKLFDGVRWSTETAMADTAASFPSGFSVAHLAEMVDVDCAEDHQSLVAQMGSFRRGPWVSR